LPTISAALADSAAIPCTYNVITLIEIEITMATATLLRDTTYQLRIDEKTKKASFAVFRELGITPAEAVRVFLNRVAQTKSIPFSLNVPNAKTLKVFTESDSGIGLKRAKNAKDLYKQLGI
jgi:DNA-damage-inducible protein J